MEGAYLTTPMVVCLLAGAVILRGLLCNCLRFKRSRTSSSLWPRPLRQSPPPCPRPPHGCSSTARFIIHELPSTQSCAPLPAREKGGSVSASGSHNSGTRACARVCVCQIVGAAEEETHAD